MGNLLQVCTIGIYYIEVAGEIKARRGTKRNPLSVW